MLASASIPVVFPPVFFEVEAGGQLYDEMHVDGGVAAMVFFNGGLFSSSVARAARGRRARHEESSSSTTASCPATPTPTPRTVRGISLRVLERPAVPP